MMFRRALCGNATVFFAAYAPVAVSCSPPLCVARVQGVQKQRHNGQDAADDLEASDAPQATLFGFQPLGAAWPPFAVRGVLVKPMFEERQVPAFGQNHDNDIRGTLIHHRFTFFSPWLV